MSEDLSDWLHLSAVALARSEVAGVVILVAAALIALAAHAVAVRLLRPLLGERHPYWSALLRATNGPSRLALLVAALAVALQLTSFDPAISDALTKILTVLTIALIGWIAITAGRLAGQLYLVRARGDDVLLAR